MPKDALVQPLYEREPDSVPGPFYVVKDVCLLCALPPETAPRNITWDDQFRHDGCLGCPNHCRVEGQPETLEEIALMIEAAEGSCIEAIRYCGTDQKILERFRELRLERLCDVLCR